MSQSNIFGDVKGGLKKVFLSGGVSPVCNAFRLAGAVVCGAVAIAVLPATAYVVSTALGVCAGTALGKFVNSLEPRTEGKEAIKMVASYGACGMGLGAIAPVFVPASLGSFGGDMVYRTGKKAIEIGRQIVRACTAKAPCSL